MKSIKVEISFDLIMHSDTYNLQHLSPHRNVFSFQNIFAIMFMTKVNYQKVNETKQMLLFCDQTILFGFLHPLVSSKISWVILQTISIAKKFS